MDKKDYIFFGSYSGPICGLKIYNHDYTILNTRLTCLTYLTHFHYLFNYILNGNRLMFLLHIQLCKILQDYGSRYYIWLL